MQEDIIIEVINRGCQCGIPYFKTGDKIMERRINDITELQKKHQREMKQKRDAVRKRKARTHRLIVRGAIAEKFVKNAEDMTDTEFQKALIELMNSDSNICHPQDSNGSSPRESPSEDTCGSNPR